MVHVKYDESLVSKGNYNRKRKEISISPRLNIPLRLYTLFHEFLHHTLNIAHSPRILDKLHDYIAFGCRYFSSFHEFRKCKRREVYRLVWKTELRKMLRRYFEGSLDERELRVPPNCLFWKEVLRLPKTNLLDAHGVSDEGYVDVSEKDYVDFLVWKKLKELEERRKTT